MLYSRYIKKIKADLRTAKANRDDAMDNKPSVAEFRSEAAWDNAIVERAIVVEKAMQDVAMLESMVDAIYSNEVKLGLQ